MTRVAEIYHLSCSDKCRILVLVDHLTLLEHKDKDETDQVLNAAAASLSGAWCVVATGDIMSSLVGPGASATMRAFLPAVSRVVFGAADA